MSYDRALTVFSPDGHLFQVEYAIEAVHKGTTAVSITGHNLVVLVVEKKSTALLQDPKTVRKIVKLDNNLALSFAGLSADARVLIKKAKIECQSYRLSNAISPSVEYIAKYLASVQQRYTQTGGRRPFGVSALICGFNNSDTLTNNNNNLEKPSLWLTDPSGTATQWIANSAGRNEQTSREFLEKHLINSATNTNKLDELKDDDIIKLAVRTILQVVESGSKNIELAVLRRNEDLKFYSTSEIEQLINEIEKEFGSEIQEERKKQEERKLF